MQKLKYFKNQYKKLYGKVNERGQMLLFVLVVLLLLFIILFAIIVNVRVDIKETQLEREYERGYSVAEEELFKIGSDGYNDWVSGLVAGGCYNPSLFPYPNYCDATYFDECCVETGLGDDGLAAIITKRKVRNDIAEMSINQDETLEVDLSRYDGNVLISWNGAPAISLMVVYQEGGEYKNVRRAVCRGAAGCYPGFEVYDVLNRLNIRSDLGLSPASVTEFMRIRAIGGDATNVTVTGDAGFPPQMEEVRVQGFSAGLGGMEEGLPGPEVYTLGMINKRLSGLFDYVLFVADGAVSK